MACFLVPAAEAAVTKIVERAEEAKETQTALESTQDTGVQITGVPLVKKLHWLSCLLTGGAVLLLFEHVWHGEITAWFPFLTAASSASDLAAMFREMATVGVTMAVAVTAAWAVMCMAADMIVRRGAENTESAGDAA